MSSIKRTFIPARPRNKNLTGGNSAGGGGTGGISSNSTGVTDPNSHTHSNKSILDRVTAEMLDNALREMLGVDSTEEATDENFFSALRTLSEIIANNELLKGLFISRVEEDIAQGRITFKEGITSQGLTELVDTHFGEFSSGAHTGTGGRIDKEGNAELTSLVLRAFLETPEIRSNRLTLIGEEIAIGAGAVIKEVSPIAGSFILELKLEEGEFNPFHYDDILKGIFNQSGGFKTSWLRVKSVEGSFMEVEMGADSKVVGGKNYPPQQFMNIARWGNFSDETRQSIIVLSAKTGNIRMIDGMDSYQGGYINSQWGKPNGLEDIIDFTKQPISENDSLLYVRTLAVQDIIRVDHKGRPIRVNGNYQLEMTPESALLPSTADGVVLDYANAKAKVRLTHDGKEIYPNLDADIDKGNMLRDSDLRFNFKYWGNTGDFIIRKEGTIIPLEATEDGRLIITENGKMIWTSKE